VARSNEEAELQAQGIDVVEQQAEEEAQADLEIAELFDEIGAAELDELESVDAAPSADEAPAEEAETSEETEEDDEK
jgi:large subunit ribosomal protein L9